MWLYAVCAHFSRQICATKTFDRNFKLVIFGELSFFYLPLIEPGRKERGAAPPHPPAIKGYSACSMHEKYRGAARLRQIHCSDITQTLKVCGERWFVEASECRSLTNRIAPSHAPCNAWKARAAPYLLSAKKDRA